MCVACEFERGGARGGRGSRAERRRLPLHVPYRWRPNRTRTIFASPVHTAVSDRVICPLPAHPRRSERTMRCDDGDDFHSASAAVSWIRVRKPNKTVTNKIANQNAIQSNHTIGAKSIQVINCSRNFITLMFHSLASSANRRSMSARRARAPGLGSVPFSESLRRRQS